MVWFKVLYWPIQIYFMKLWRFVKNQILVKPNNMTCIYMMQDTHFIDSVDNNVWVDVQSVWPQVMRLIDVSLTPCRLLEFYKSSTLALVQTEQWPATNVTGKHMFAVLCCTRHEQVHSTSYSTTKF